MTYNPYDLVDLVINGEKTYGRPCEFDSEVVDQIKMTNAFGKVIRPSKVSTTCPKCGSGLVVSISITEESIGPIEIACDQCKPKDRPPPDPFQNPLNTGMITFNDLNPNAVTNAKLLPTTKPLAERLSLEPSPLGLVHTKEELTLEEVLEQPPAKPPKKKSESQPFKASDIESMTILDLGMTESEPNILETSDLGLSLDDEDEDDIPSIETLIEEGDGASFADDDQFNDEEFQE